jgi:type IV pilus assembly protein PilB
LVFSTLHTNDAPSAITRLVDMGVPSYLVASSVMAIMAQRLVRVVCQKCKQPYKPSESSIEAAGIAPHLLTGANFMRGKGCNHCGHSGFRGRLGIFELMMMSSKVRELTFNERPTAEVRQTAINEGMKTLYADGIRKVVQGVTTLEEALRVAKPTEQD